MFHDNLRLNHENIKMRIPNFYSSLSVILGGGGGGGVRLKGNETQKLGGVEKFLEFCVLGGGGGYLLIIGRNGKRKYRFLVGI